MVRATGPYWSRDAGAEHKGPLTPTGGGRPLLHGVCGHFRSFPSIAAGRKALAVAVGKIRQVASLLHVQGHRL
jgi:hypothetical protein